MCRCRDVICDDSSEFWEVNELFVGPIQGSCFVLECSDCAQHATTRDHRVMFWN